MHKQLPTWKLIQASLRQNVAVMLLYVLQSKGSSPGRQGFFMAVNAYGEMSGSLGGGIMEHKFVELAKLKLLESGREISVHQQLHDKSAARNQSGMICSGEQTIFLYTVLTSDGDQVNALISSLEENKNGTLQLSPQGISFSANIPAEDFSLEQQQVNDFIYQEKTGYKNLLYIVGGGHCALAFSRLMSGMDFYIRLFDDRQDLNTIAQNNFVHERTSVDDYAVLKELITSGKNVYVVVMTFGYRTDGLALRALMGKNFKYFGVLGSKFKISKMLKDLSAEGVAPQILKSMHAPVGLPIKSQTTEEIAISIAAEIIQVKNKNL